MTARNEQLAESIGNIGTALETFQQKNAVALQEVQTKQLELQDRLEDIEARASSPGAVRRSNEAEEHKKLFLDWVRKPDSAGAKTALENIEKHLQSKSVLIATPSAGGFAVPELLLRDIEKFELAQSPVRRLVRVEQIGSGDVRFLVNLRGRSLH